jgi:hypothetical protein
MITEKTIIDKIEVLHTGDVQIRQANQVIKDGAIIASTYHRRTISIFEQNPDLSQLDEVTRSIVEAARTQERLDAAQKLAEQQLADETE